MDHINTTSCEKGNVSRCSESLLADTGFIGINPVKVLDFSRVREMVEFQVSDCWRRCDDRSSIWNDGPLKEEIAVN